jgi:phosphatidylethanolamine-binding protein (PEBP) family uncharacterized protein
MNLERVMPWLLFAVVLDGCATWGTGDEVQLGVDFRFDAKHKCQGVSPEIRLTNVPPHVALYEVRLTDLDVPGANHWHEVLPANGPMIPEAAGTAYRGPCPPFGQHRYEMSVTAKGAQGQPLAHGAKTVFAAR